MEYEPVKKKVQSGKIPLVFRRNRPIFVLMEAKGSVKVDKSSKTVAELLKGMGKPCKSWTDRYGAKAVEFTPTHWDRVERFVDGVLVESWDEPAMFLRQARDLGFVYRSKDGSEFFSLEALPAIDGPSHCGQVIARRPSKVAGHTPGGPGQPTRRP
jgi:hypothetical protein